MDALAIDGGRIEVAPTHPAFAGHFPGRPVLPGVAIVAEVLEAAWANAPLAAAIGTPPALAVAKFLAPVGPGATLAISFSIGARGVDWRVDAGTTTVASGRFAPARGDEEAGLAGGAPPPQGLAAGAPPQGFAAGGPAQGLAAGGPAQEHAGAARSTPANARGPRP